MCRDEGSQSVHVHGIFLPESATAQSNPWTETYRRHLVRTTQHKLQLVNGHIHSPEQRCDAVTVVFGAVLDQLNRSLEVIQEPVDIG